LNGESKDAVWGGAAFLLAEVLRQRAKEAGEDLEAFRKSVREALVRAAIIIVVCGGVSREWKGCIDKIKSIPCSRWLGPFPYDVRRG